MDTENWSLGWQPALLPEKHPSGGHWQTEIGSVSRPRENAERALASSRGRKGTMSEMLAVFVLPRPRLGLPI